MFTNIPLIDVPSTIQSYIDGSEVKTNCQRPIIVLEDFGLLYDLSLLNRNSSNIRYWIVFI